MQASLTQQRDDCAERMPHPHIQIQFQQCCFIPALQQLQSAAHRTYLGIKVFARQKQNIWSPTLCCKGRSVSASSKASKQLTTGHFYHPVPSQGKFFPNSSGNPSKPEIWLSLLGVRWQASMISAPFPCLTWVGRETTWGGAGSTELLILAGAGQLLAA